MLKVMQREKVDINVSNFKRSVFMKDDQKFDERARGVFKEHNFGFLKEIFLTKKNHAKLDIYLQIKKYDSIWIDKHDNIVAYWDHNTKLLYY